ncbi:hypothetical protein CDL15_Pgr013728 [Punica granatum]|uniref:Uncharacterized protein n=1 Tax=Punica granatum TaxID=22663 RepID=A0A218W2Q0_PUNGR|nr:hypothetical protein CDL15_Pgr013728 [Punica granatum]PKI67324.1 hypothetical protein CRG98_012273 [Punica granatum]
MGYNRVAGPYKRSSSSASSSSSSSCRGFKIKPRKFSVQRLRSRVLSLFKVLRRFRSSCARALRLLCSRRRQRRLRSRIERSNSMGSNSSRRRMIGVEEPYVVRPSCRYGSFERSNSFYAEAIADCLDFIRRSSVSTDQSSSSPKADI